MKIPGPVYLIVGAFIFGFTFWITNTNPSLDLMRFAIFLGFAGLFIIIGLVKTFASLLGKKKHKSHKANHHHHNPHQMHQHQQHHAHAPQHANVKYCTHCKAAVRTFDRFCYRCGNQHFHSR